MSDEVEAYCAATQDLGDQLAAVADDPTSGDIVELTRQATELQAQGRDLVTANFDDQDVVARIDECSNALIDSAVGG